MNNISKIIFAVVMGGSSLYATAQTQTPSQNLDVKPITKLGNDTIVVNTTTLAQDVIGYRSATPLEIFIKSGKIVKVEALKNQETPKYFVRIKKELLPKYEDMKVSKVSSTPVDAITGCTMSSVAVFENVKRGIEYYEKNKK